MADPVVKEWEYASMSGETRGKPVDVKPRPRTILQFEDAELGGQVEGVFPFEHVVEWSDPLHSPDWDVMLADTTIVNRDPSLFVVAFGADQVQNVRVFEERFLESDAIAKHVESARTLRRVGPTSARDLIVPNGLPEDIERLVRSDLVPGYEGGQPRQYLQLTYRHPHVGPVQEQHPQLFMQPFLVTSDGSVLAGRVRRANEPEGVRGECWVLPDWVPNPRDWVKAAWRAWHEFDQDAIPKPPDWTDSSEWHTPEESRLSAEIHEVMTEKNRVIADLDAKLDALGTAMETARGEAESGPRRMLTSQGPELVAAVKSALEDLGFEAQDMDEVHPENDRREDLRVRTTGEFEAIAEIRGYKGGAASNDLLRLGRFASRYQQERGTPPSAQWYIVNELLGQDAGTRPTKALLSKPDEVSEFGQYPGAVISSVALYRLWRRAMSGDLSKEEARQRLLDCRGYFEL